MITLMNIYDHTYKYLMPLIQEQKSIPDSQHPQVSSLIQQKSSQMAITIQSMKDWLQNYSLQQYEALLIQQSQLYAKMQKLIKKNESQLSNLKLKEVCKQNLTDRILEYNVEIEKLTAMIRQRQLQKIQNRQVRRAQKAETLELQKKMQKIKSNKREKKQNREKVRYLKDKVIRVYKQINTESLEAKELQYQVQKRKMEAVPITKNHSETYTQASALKPELKIKGGSEEKWLGHKIEGEGHESERLPSIQ